MLHITYYVISLLVYIIFSSVVWSLGFILLSKKIKSLKILTVSSTVLVIISVTALAYVLENLFYGTISMYRVLITTSVHYIIFSVIISKTLFKKLPGPIIKQVVPSDTKRIKLETGSEIAYWHFQGDAPRRDKTIFYVHGGPGAHVRNIDREFFREYTSKGYDVVLYDQAGGGFSGYLNLDQYTMDRFIQDLECVRKEIKADKLILVGQSFGARICSYYAASYPNRVESIVFAGPAGLASKSIKQNTKDEKKLKRSKVELADGGDNTFKPKFRELIRFSFVVVMSKIGGEKVVDQLVTQDEIVQYSTRMIPDAIAKAYHKKYQDRVPNITSGGINVIVNVLLHNDYDKISQTVISDLMQSDIPVLILRGAYDYVPWEDTKSYKEVFKNNYLVYIEESGHIAWSINKEDTFNSILNFVNGEVERLECYKGDSDPLY